MGPFIIEHSSYNETNDYIENLKNELMRSSDRLDGLSVSAISTLLDFAEANPIDVSKPVSIADIKKLTNDKLIIDRLLSAGIFYIKDELYYLYWQNDEAGINVARALLILLNTGELTIPDLAKRAEFANKQFEGRVLLALKLGAKQSPKREELVKFLKNRTTQLLQNNFFDDYELSYPAPTFPGYPWDQLYRSFEHSHFRKKSTAEELEYIFCVYLLSYLSPSSIFSIKDSCSSPARLVSIDNRFDIEAVDFSKEIFSSKMIASFISWTLESHFSSTYAKWIHKTNSWRSTMDGKSKYESVELLREKELIDRMVLRQSEQYFETLIRSPIPDKPLLALHHYEAAIASLKKNWQSTVYETEGLKHLLDKAILIFFKNMSPQPSGQQIFDCFSQFISQSFSTFTKRASFIAELSLLEDAIDVVKIAGLQSVQKQLEILCQNPFGEYPYYNGNSSNKSDKELFAIARLIFSNSGTSSQLVQAFDQEIHAVPDPTKVNSEKAYNQKLISAYLCRIFLLSLKLEDNQKITSLLRDCYAQHIKDQIEFGPFVGLENELLESKIILEADLPDQNSSFDPSTLKDKEKIYYAKNLISSAKYEDAKAFFKTEVVEKFEDTKNYGGETSESIYFWLLSLLHSESTTKEEFARGLSIFSKNRECIGIDDQSRFALATAIAERAGSFDKALEYCDKAIKDNPGCLDSWLNKAIVYLKSGDGRRALLTCELIPELYWNVDRVAHIRLATQIAAAEHLPKVAISLADELIAKHEGDDDARYNKAVAHVLMGDIQTAVDLCNIVQSHLPSEHLSADLLKKLSDESFKRYSEVLKSGLPIKIPAILSGDLKHVSAKRINVGSESRRTTKIAIAQIGFPAASTAEEFLSEKASKECFDAVERAVGDSASQQCEMLFLPELIIPLEYKDKLEQLSKSKNIWIVGGARYEKHENGLINKSVLISPSAGLFAGAAKICISPKDLPNTIAGSEVAFFEGTPIGKICTLICFDPYHPAMPSLLQHEKADVVFVPGANKDNDRLRSIVDSISSQLCIPIIVSNITKMGNSFYTATGFKRELEEKFDRFSKTTTDQRDQIISVTIPDASILSQYLPHRPDRPLPKDSEL